MAGSGVSRTADALGCCASYRGMSSVQNEPSPLLQPMQTAVLMLPNRVCMAPMTRGRADNPGHVPTELMVEYYRQRASAGLIVTEGTHISPRANGWEHVPGIYTPEQVAGWRRVTDAVHAAGGRIWCQLWHQGRVSTPELLDGALPLAPSAMIAKGASAYIDGGYKQSPIPEAASAEDLQQTIADFRYAAQCADKAGFDGVELHGANGYLIHQFLTTQANQRTDSYGGTLENRARFLFDVIDAVHEVLPPERVALRLSPSMNDMQGLNLDDRTAETFDYVVKRLNGAQLAYLHLLEPMKPVDAIPYAVKDVAAHFRPIYRGTLMINKGFTFDTGNKVLADGLADLVSFGTPFIANPDLVERFATQATLAKPDKETFYTPGAHGYTDYPKL